MSLKKYILLIVLLAFNSSFSFGQSFQWAKSIQSEGYDEGFDLTTDSQGNTYVAGQIEFDTDFGNGVILTSAGIHDIFLAKYNPSGNLVWAKRAGGKGGDKAQSIALDGLGNVFIVGEYDDTCYWESIMKVVNGGRGINNMFVAKYDTSGSVIWVRNLGTTGLVQGRGYGITCDPQGNVYACGGTKGDTYYDSTFLFTSAGDYDGTVVKFDPNGNFIWARRMGGADSDKTYGIVCDNNGSIYVTGYFVGNADFSPTVTLHGSGHTDIFLAKFDYGGTLQWAKMAGDTGYDRGWDVTMNINGQIIITGACQTGFFGTNQVFTRGNEDMFLAGYNSNGDNLWAITGGSEEDDIGRGVSTDASGNILVIGDYASTGYFPPATITSNGFAEVFVASYNSDGSNLNWIRSMGSPYNDRGRGISSAPSGDISICGEFEDSLQVGNTLLVGDTYLDIFVSKISSSNACGTLVNTSSSSSCPGQCDATATAYATGQSPFNYAWSTVPAQFTEIATGLCQGTYVVIISDGNGCTSSTSVTITDPILQTTATTTDASCSGACNGTASLVVTGRNPISYEWSTNPMQTTDTATGLCAGNYSVLVTDAYGCQTTESVSISEPTPIQINAVVTNSTCIGCTDGSIDLTTTGGGSGYQYVWSNGQLIEDINSLEAGTYDVCVTDNNNCTLCNSYFILDSGTKVDDFAKDSFSVFPNPFTSQATIHVKTASNLTTKIEMYNSIGQTIFQDEFQGKEYLLNAKTFPTGIYYLHLNNGTTLNESIKLVILEEK